MNMLKTKIMKRILFLLLLLPSLIWAQTPKTDAQLKAQSDQIRNAVGPGSITPIIHANMEQAVIDSKANVNLMATVTASGTDTYTATIAPALTVIPAQFSIKVVFTNANTGATTINFNSIGAKSIKKTGTSALSANDICAGCAYWLIWDGTNFQLTGGAGAGLSSGLSAGHMFVGNGSNIASDVAMSGDVSLSSAGFTTVNRILGNAIPANASGSLTNNGSGVLTWSAGVGALLAANNLSDVGNAGTSRTNLGVAIGTDVEAHDADLTTIAGLSPTNDDIIQRKSGAWTNRTPAQYKSDLLLNNVENTALSTWSGSSNITTVGGLTSGSLAGSFTPVTVPFGGTGKTSLTAYAPLFGGTTSTGVVQSGAVGTSGQVLTSNGAGALATFQTPSAGFSNPMTTSGDFIYDSVGNVTTRFAGNTTGTKKFLTMTSSVPGWNGIVSGDIPSSISANTSGTADHWTTAKSLGGNSIDGSINVAFSNKFIVQGTADAGLSAAQFLGALATGIVKNTTTTGVLSIAVAGDFPTLNQNTSGSAATLTTGRTIAATGDVSYTSPSFNGSGNVTAAATVTGLNGTSLSGLATGLLKNTTGTGVPSIADFNDLQSLGAARNKLTQNTQTGDYTLQGSDFTTDTEINMSSSSAHVLTVPPNSTLALDSGRWIYLRQSGTSTFTVSPGAGVTITSSSGGFTSSGQNSEMWLKKDALNGWYLANGTSPGGISNSQLANMAVGTVKGVSSTFFGGSAGAPQDLSFLNVRRDVFDVSKYYRLYSDFSGGSSEWSSGASGTGATINYTTDGGDAGHTGVVTLPTGTTNTGQIGLRNGNLSTFTQSDGALFFDTSIKLSAVGDVTDTYTVRAGFGLGTNSDGSDIAEFQYLYSANGGRWQIITAHSSVQTVADCGGSTVAAATYYRLTIISNSANTSYAFYLNGTQCSNSPITTHLPTVANSAIVSITKSAGTTSRSMGVDWLHVMQEFNSSR